MERGRIHHPAAGGRRVTSRETYMSNSPTIPLRQNVVYALHQALSQAGACGPREAAAGQARRLADHAADAGMFRSAPEHGELFRFGREPDGRP